MKTLLVVFITALCLNPSAQAMGHDSAPFTVTGPQAFALIQNMKASGFTPDSKGDFNRAIVSCTVRQPGDVGYTGNPQKDAFCEIYENGN